MNPHHIHGFSETHEVATNNTATPATSTATNINSKPAVTSNFPNSSSGISRPISLKPVVDTSMANYPSGFQSTASSPSNPSRGEFKPKETGSFQSSPLSGGSRGMTGRNRRRQLIVECRRLRSEVSTN